MRATVLHSQNLTVEERNLLSVAYNNVVGSLRSSWRVVVSIEHSAEQKGDLVALQRVRSYRVKIEDQLRLVCDEVLELVELIIRSPEAVDEQLQVFVHNVKGNYYRYLAEISDGDVKAGYRNSSTDAYCVAQNLSSSLLPPTHPIRLGLALSVAVFSYEILGQTERACELAKKAFDEAIDHMDELSEAEYKDSTLIMQLLRDNLALWLSEQRAAKLP